jgi:hypothetical protein
VGVELPLSLMLKRQYLQCIVRLAVVWLCALLPMPETFAQSQGSGPGIADLSAPAPAGKYARLAIHPGVFTTRGELQDLAKRINVSGSYSAMRFNKLADQIGRDLSGHKEWGAAYSGCNSDVYNYGFSYESQTTHGVDHAAQIKTILRLDPDSTPPAGAAVVASRLALYAALVKAGAPARAPSPDQAAALAKQILIAWSTRGFQNGHGHFLSTPSQFCDQVGKTNDGVMTGVGLLVSRGIVYSVHAQDLLMYLGTLNAAEAQQANAFHSAMFELIRNALNYNFSEHHAWACDHYSNHAANQLTGLLALARILDSQERFEAVLHANNPSVPVKLSWAGFFQRAIYGEADRPNACYANNGPDGNTSKPFFETAIVAPGEIDDRYRNADASQGIGYSMFTLERLFDAAEVLRNAGYDPYGYRGTHHQSIEMAAEYYACYAKSAGFYKTITEDNSNSCPDAKQYYGKVVNGIDRLLTIGALRFPQNRSIASLEAGAKAASSSGPFSVDAILFGKWRD